MEFLATFAISCFAVMLLRRVIRQAPYVFYLAAFVLVILQAMAELQVAGFSWAGIIPLVRKCNIAMSLFAIVMYIGVVPQKGKIGKDLHAIRSSLSIMACILMVGHILPYASIFISRAFSGALSGSTAASLLIAAALVILLLLLGGTSLNAVKARISGSTWKRIQSTSYVFFGLIYLHVLLMLAPSAIQGRASAIESMVCYSVLFGVYAVLRIGKALMRKRPREQA